MDGGIGSEERLLNAWHLLNGTLIHFVHDNFGEEMFHAALYMMQKAGVVGKCVSTVDDFAFDENVHI